MKITKKRLVADIINVKAQKHIVRISYRNKDKKKVVVEPG